MAILLPPTIALRSTWFDLYLNYSSDSDSKEYGFLKFNGANVFSSLAKFEIVAANTGTGQVHIRCVHNKKFIRTGPMGLHLSPDADEPEEDRGKWSCTLFEPRETEDGNPDHVHLLHVRTNQYAFACDTAGIRYWALSINPHHQTIYDVIDLESLVILPKHVAFKSNNDRYLQHVDGNQIRFISTDKGIAESWFEVSTDGHGRVKIKSFNNNYLRFEDGDNVISANGDSNNSSNPPSEFWPVKIDNSTVALQCMGNGKFCTRDTGNIQNGLYAKNPSFSISNNSCFKLEELVLSRRIYNTDFNLENAIIYDESPVTMATSNASNNTSGANTVKFKFKFKESKSSTWGASHSWMVGVNVTVGFKIPFIGGTKVTANTEYSGSYKWGEAMTFENTLETTYTVTVPPHTSISVSLMATKGKCDVPYSYYQKDVLYNGTNVIYKKDDGLYTGANSYNFRYEVATVKEPVSRAYLPNTEQMLPDPSIGPSIEQMIPLPMPSGSKTAQASGTSTTSLEQELSRRVDDVALA